MSERDLQSPGPRDRMIRSAAQLIRRNGVSGTGLREVVIEADAPRGSLQHYFPNGKDQLVGEALRFMGSVAGRRARRALESSRHQRPSELLAGVIDGWKDDLLGEGFEAGCPLVAAAADVLATNDQLRGEIASAFDDWQTPLIDALVETGIARRRASALAVLIISALEGAIVLARVSQDTTPLDIVNKEIGPILDAASTADEKRS
jgi:AcrR family transcriptional regulator